MTQHFAVNLILSLLLMLVLLTACSRSSDELLAEVAVLQQQGAILNRKQAYDEARDVFTQAIDLAPQQWLLYAGRGQAYLGLKQVEQARADFEQVVTQAAQLADKDKQFLAAAYYYLGLIELSEENHEQALANLDKCLANAPNPNVYYHELQNTAVWGGLYMDQGFQALVNKYWPSQPGNRNAEPKPVYPKPPPPPGL